jgi:hypothetical protein
LQKASREDISTTFARKPEPVANTCNHPEW